MRTPSISSPSAPAGSAKRACASASATHHRIVRRRRRARDRASSSCERQRSPLQQRAASPPRLERAVADVVDAPRERVHRAHRPAPLARQQADAVVEVRRLRARDRLAVRVGALDRRPWRSSRHDARAPAGPCASARASRRPRPARGGAGEHVVAGAARSRPGRRARRRGTRRRRAARARAAAPISGAPASSSSRARADLEGEQRAHRLAGVLARAARAVVQPKRSRSSRGRYTRPAARSSATSWQCSVSCRPVQIESDSAIRAGVASPSTPSTSSPTGSADSAQ